jgi:hypothetical protein
LGSWRLFGGLIGEVIFGSLFGAMKKNL